jgi:hypothetical protein
MQLAHIAKRKLVTQYGIILHEELNITGIVRSWLATWMHSDASVCQVWL